MHGHDSHWLLIQAAADLFRCRFGLFILIRPLRHKFDTVSLEAGDYVHVRMMHDLACVLAVIHRDIYAVGT